MRPYPWPPSRSPSPSSRKKDERSNRPGPCSLRLKTHNNLARQVSILRIPAPAPSRVLPLPLPARLDCWRCWAWHRHFSASRPAFPESSGSSFSLSACSLPGELRLDRAWLLMVPSSYLLPPKHENFSVSHHSGVFSLLIKRGFLGGSRCELIPAPRLLHRSGQ